MVSRKELLGETAISSGTVAIPGRGGNISARSVLLAAAGMGMGVYLGLLAAGITFDL